MLTEKFAKEDAGEPVERQFSFLLLGYVSVPNFIAVKGYLENLIDKSIRSHTIGVWPEEDSN
jgi:hypothetical protein